MFLSPPPLPLLPSAPSLPLSKNINGENILGEGYTTQMRVLILLAVCLLLCA